jgi:electron transfer flavoprotein alpha subunit
MNEIFVLTEHRQGQIRDITFEMLTKARELAQNANIGITAVILGNNIEDNGKILSSYAEKTVCIENSHLEHFNSERYHAVLSALIKEHNPLLTMIGHTSYGIELAPRLAVALDIPLATDCLNLAFKNEKLCITRQMYGGKVNVEATLRPSKTYMVTIRQAAFTSQKPPEMTSEITNIPYSFQEQIPAKRFVRYVLPPVGGVDITAAEKLIGIGRGIKDQSNMAIVEELANVLGAVLACSRPIVDKGWLSNDRQVGSSGKTVKPKLYLAVGVSGAFQHVLGMKSSDLIIAVNKDPNAPIFSFADYGVIEDLFKLVPSLTNKVNSMK